MNPVNSHFDELERLPLRKTTIIVRELNDLELKYVIVYI
jgi:hypothetical protein